MDYEQAKQHLLFQAGIADPAGTDFIWDESFLGCLRPYSGLREKNFHLIVEALLTVGERIHRETIVDRDLVRAMWSLCDTARGWGIHPQGMLQRNKLISTEDSKRLDLWIGTIEVIALKILSGWPSHHAVHYYANYVISTGFWDNAPFFIALMIRALEDPNISDSIETISQALGKFGKLAIDALPSLREAEQREYTWYIPEELCTKETRTQISQAIRLIEGG